jgi:RNA polymerase sigma-70 factor, ECF subfamily
VAEEPRERTELNPRDMIQEPEEIRPLIERARRGEAEARDELFSRFRDRMLRMVRMRLDRRLQARIDSSDIVQEAFLEASRRLDEYLREPRLPFFLWLRCLTGQKLLFLHRHHLGVQCRDARREVRLYRGPFPETSSETIADHLLGKLTTPSQAALRAERKVRLQEALNTMDPMDREVLVLRHLEHLSNAEAAHEMGVEKSAASKRYVRALKKLKEILLRLDEGPREKTGGWEF